MFHPNAVHPHDTRRTTCRTFPPDYLVETFFAAQVLPCSQEKALPAQSLALPLEPVCGFRFVGRARGGHKINRVQMKTLFRGLRHGDVAGMDRIKRAAKERDRAAMRGAVRFVRGLRAQLSSRGGAAWASSGSASRSA